MLVFVGEKEGVVSEKTKAKSGAGALENVCAVSRTTASGSRSRDELRAILSVVCAPGQRFTTTYLFCCLASCAGHHVP